MAYIQERTLSRNLVFFTPREAGLETSGNWLWSIKAPCHTHTLGLLCTSITTGLRKEGGGAPPAQTGLDMSLGQSGDLALVTSFPLWVYNKSLAAKDILKEAALGGWSFSEV